jgi:hypothetical protein
MTPCGLIDRYQFSKQALSTILMEVSQDGKGDYIKGEKEIGHMLEVVNHSSDWKRQDGHRIHSIHRVLSL